jgi:hypothetical protein
VDAVKIWISISGCVRRGAADGDRGDLIATSIWTMAD